MTRKATPNLPQFLSFKPIWILLLMLGIGSAMLHAQSPVTYSTPGTYTFTVPACVTSITVQCWGAGGGGGGADEGGSGAAGAGGGGGGYASATLTNLSATYTVVVGTGGTMGNTSGGNGGAGGSSSVTNGTVTVTGGGGGGGTGEAASGVASPGGTAGNGTLVGVTGTTYKGGTGGLGNNDNYNDGGGGGGGAGSSGNGVTPATPAENVGATGGAGGPGNPNGAGGSVTADWYENGGNGNAYGGGGGGGGGEDATFHPTDPGSGGLGGNGGVIITYSTSVPTITSLSGSGCPGSTITIDGTLLTGATSVKVGTVAVTNLSITSTVITGTIGAGTITGTVSVTTSCGTATSSGVFAVYPAVAVNLGTQSICGGAGYTLGGHTYTTAGTYSDTANSVHGCDSITTVTLIGGATINKSISQSICTGGNYNFGGHTYTAQGTYADTATSTVTGCDSITTLTLSVAPVITQSISQSVCGGGTYSFGGHTYGASGTYMDTATSTVSGCDSITTLTLTITGVLYHATQQSICAGSSYSFNGNSYTASGTYADTLIGAGQHGCDSISALILTVNQAATSTTQGAICNNSSYTFNGVNYTVPGTYIDTLTGASATGCDSIATLILALKSTSGDSVSATAAPPEFCSGDSTQICATQGFAQYNWGGGITSACFYTTSAGDYTVTVTDTSGCTATSNQVQVSNYSPTSVTISTSGDTLTSFGAAGYQWFINNQPITGDTGSTIIATQSGSYTVEITDNHGCHYTSSAVPITTAITNLQTGDAIKVYPNPLTGGNWQLQVSESMIGSWCEVFDNKGQLVYKSAITNQQSAIVIPNEASGVYEMRITSADASYNLKLIKLY